LRAALRFTSRAAADWKKLDVATKERIDEALEALRQEPRPANLDDKALEGRAPWRRLRVGDHRVIFRTFTAAERRQYESPKGYVIERLIDRRDLDRATKGLR